MCGICGIVYSDPQRTADAALVASMARVISHRGPDDDGFHIAGNVGLGFRRLAIIDLSGGHQPIYNEDGSVALVYNGEIYNYTGLTQELLAQGHSFRTRSDTETVVHAYEQYGERCVERLRGMFAFALWDQRRRRLLLARDRLGKKPLYYYQNQSFLAFASEIKALLEIPEIPREVDTESLDLYLSLRYVPGPRTMFRNIYKLQPGHTLLLEDGQVQIRKYWDIEYRDPEPRPDQYYLEKFQALLEESVRLRLMSEVPLGVFLSGGLDSSAMVAIMSKLVGGERVKTFSVGYKARNAREEESNELDYARLAATTFKTDHHEYRLDASEFGDFLPDLVWHLDEPMADPSCVPLYFIARLAREHITVVLSGEGADEILAGYVTYRRLVAMDNLHRGLSPLSAWIFPSLAALAPGDKVRHYLRLLGLPLEARYRGMSRGLLPEVKDKLWMGNGNSRALLDEVFAPYFKTVQGTSPLNQMLYVDAKLWLPEDLLMKADKITMAASLELRCPFLDQELVEFAASLPLALKRRGATGKVLLRQAMRGRLPDALIDRPKKGFPVPTESWLSDQLKSLVRQSLLAPDSACRRYLNPAALEQVVRENELGQPNRHQEIWTLLVFEYWHRLFVDRTLTASRPSSHPPARAADARVALLAAESDPSIAGRAARST